MKASNEREKGRLSSFVPQRRRPKFLNPITSCRFLIVIGPFEAKLQVRLEDESEELKEQRGKGDMHSYVLVYLSRRPNENEFHLH